jgi:uracil-DNA glycosylase
MDKAFNELIDEAISLVKTYQANPTIKIYKSDLKSSNYSIKYPSPDYEFDNEKKFITIKEKSSNKNYNPTETSSSETYDWKSSTDLNSFAEGIKNCSKCNGLKKTRTQVVFGTGNPDADIMVIGEAPGADEDKQGKPFVGRAGQLLTKILEAIDLKREEVYIANILKCRPPENRNPAPDEISNCEPYLYHQLKLIKPKLILALGTFAAQTLLRTKEPLGKLRGKFHDYNGIKTMVTYHPAALLRNPNWKKPAWEDVKQLKSEYEKMKG